MIVDQLLAAFERAFELTGHRDYVVIGSLSILGLDADTPADMSMSIDIDCYTMADPQRIFDVQAALGEGSAFHRSFGYFLDPVSPDLPSLPDGWRNRMNSVERGNVRVHFLDPNDAAVSKYARGDPRDQRWIRSGIEHGLVSLPIVAARIRNTNFLDTAERDRVATQLRVDRDWLAAQHPAQKKRAPKDPFEDT